MSKKETNRRDFLFTATYAVGAVGVGATIWPMIDQMNPDASVKALASTEIDVSAVNPGKTITVLWRGKPVFIRRRTQDEIAEAKAVKLEDVFQITNELEKNKITYEVNIYSGAPHAFTVFNSKRYRKDADEKSWEAFLSFIDKKM